MKVYVTLREASVLRAVEQLGRMAYGAEIHRWFEIRHPQAPILAPATIYIVLIALGRKGLVRSLMRKPAQRGRGGRGRRIYMLTQRGRDTLTEIERMIERRPDEPAKDIGAG